MFKLFRNPRFMLVTGTILGAVAGLLVGVFVLQRTNQIDFPVTPLHATATHGGDTIALATGPIADQTEGLFALDFLTGELQCLVMNPRSRKLGGMFRTNVVKDLGVGKGKQPKYLMVTGFINWRTTGGNMRPAQTIVYVADANTGHFAAYGLPWNRNAAQYNFSQVQPFVRLGIGNVRNIQIEGN